MNKKMILGVVVLLLPCAKLFAPFTEGWNGKAERAVTFQASDPTVYRYDWLLPEGGFQTKDERSSAVAAFNIEQENASVQPKLVTPTESFHERWERLWRPLQAQETEFYTPETTLDEAEMWRLPVSSDNMDNMIVEEAAVLQMPTEMPHPPGLPAAVSSNTPVTPDLYIFQDDMEILLRDLYEGAYTKLIYDPMVGRYVGVSSF